jgi:hypothetical protein
MQSKEKGEWFKREGSVGGVGGVGGVGRCGDLTHPALTGTPPRRGFSSLKPKA